MKMNQLLKLIIVGLAFTSVGLVRPVAGGQSCTTPPAGLVAWLPGDNNTLDYQGDANGTLQNGATYAPGMVAQGFSFDGVDDDVLIPFSPILNVGAANGLTVDAWINPSTTDGSPRPIVEWNNGSTFGVHFWISVTQVGGVPNNLFANLMDTAGNFHFIQSAMGVITANTYQHVALTYDKTSGEAVLYWNGTIVAQANLGVFTPQTTYNLYLAKRAAGSAAGTAYAGAIDEVEVFNRALSQSEIQAIVNAGSAGKCKPPVLIQPAVLPNGAPGLSYNQTITALLGTAPYTYTLSNGSLPPGISLSTDGVISGTPQTAGAFNFTVQVTDTASQTAQRNYLITIITCTPSPSGLVGWYPGDGNAVDIQSGSNGSLQGGATFAPGKVAQAFSLNGTSAYVQAPAIAAQDPTDAGSLDAWVYLNQTPAQAGHDMSIIVKGGSGTDFNLQVFNRSGADRFYLQIASSTFVASTTVVQAGQWYHVAGTWDSTIGLKIYVNGVLENTNSTLLTRGQSGQPFTIGRDPIFGPRQFYGLIDEPQIFNRALTPSEVQAIFNAGIAGQCKSPSPSFCGEISGQITDTQGPLQGALVQACEPNNGPCAFNATTDGNGNYQITGLPLNTPFDLTVFPPQGSVDVPSELLNRSVTACGAPLSNQNAMLQAPAPPSSGTSIDPHGNGGGGVPAVYWQSPLTLTTTGCPFGTASYIISRGFSVFASGPMTETSTGSGTFTASVPALFPAHGAATVAMTIDCGGGGTIITGFDIYIDPSGTVRDSHGAPISGATVTLLRSDTAMGPFDIVPDGSAVMSPGNRHNPDMTDTEGHFGWDVLAGFYKVRAENAGCNGMVETGVLQIPPPVTDLVLTLDCPTELIGAVSRKNHGAAGELDIPLALTGSPTVECRGSGGNHKLVFTFTNNIVSGSASLTTQSGGSISGSPTFAGDTMTVNLTGVADIQKITLTLSGVTDAFTQVVPDTAVSMNLLIGDTSGNKSVNSTDVSITKAQSGHIVTNSNAREDVDANGAINGTDVSIVKLHVGSGLP